MLPEDRQTLEDAVAELRRASPADSELDCALAWLRVHNAVHEVLDETADGDAGYEWPVVRDALVSLGLKFEGWDYHSWYGYSTSSIINSLTSYRLSRTDA